ncbi:MAG: AbrB/MazE/SpoVT family DNA-binding domain-containing protein [Selenomonadaceae bacterium]|nr:AbrB/MazE/SpoVT family DNA-binding domain-containing protein [Selenomonadaceae bacterium]
MKTLQYLDIDDQGRITLPDDILRSLGKKRGDTVALVQKDGNIKLEDDLYVIMHKEELKDFEPQMTPQAQKALQTMLHNREIRAKMRAKK